MRRKFDASLTGIERIMNLIGAACLVGMMLLTCIDVVGRHFGHPIFGSVELVGFMATITVAMALPYTHGMRAHTGVEILVQRLSARSQVLLRAITGCLGLLLFIIIAWQMTVYGRTMAQSGEVSMNLELPEYIIIYMVAFCFVIACLRILKDVCSDAHMFKDVK